MSQISTSELLAKLSLWKHQEAGLMAMFTTPEQVAFAQADLSNVTDTRVNIQLVGAIQRPLSHDDLIHELSFSPADVLAVWHSTTFQRPQHIHLVALFDEVLEFSIQNPLTDIVIWRATPKQLH